MSSSILKHRMGDGDRDGTSHRDVWGDRHGLTTQITWWYKHILRQYLWKRRYITSYITYIDVPNSQNGWLINRVVNVYPSFQQVTDDRWYTSHRPPLFFAKGHYWWHIQQSWWYHTALENLLCIQLQTSWFVVGEVPGVYRSEGWIDLGLDRTCWNRPEGFPNLFSEFCNVAMFLDYFGLLWIILDYFIFLNMIPNIHHLWISQTGKVFSHHHVQQIKLCGKLDRPNSPVNQSVSTVLGLKLLAWQRLIPCLVGLGFTRF